jgi:predicted RNA-binding protein (virulence factor B family)
VPMKIGEFNDLRIMRDTSVGLYLSDEDGEEVLLPNKYVPENVKPDQIIRVFIYKDSEDRLIATTLDPYIILHEFASLKVVDVTDYGAFLDWGLEKDLLVPFREQKMKMEVGRYYTVFLYLDEQTGRLAATAKIDKFLETEDISVMPGDEVEILVTHYSDLGANVIINNLHKGLIYNADLYRELEPGERTIAYIKNVKEDKKIDVMLQRPGFERVEESSDIILNVLNDSNGFLPLSDKSSPDEIVRVLQMSKKTFKKAIGILYKQRLIKIEENGIYLVK